MIKTLRKQGRARDLAVRRVAKGVDQPRPRDGDRNIEGPDDPEPPGAASLLDPTQPSFVEASFRRAKDPGMGIEDHDPST